MLSDLLLDIRFHIATFDEDVWYLFYKHFDDFKLLACRSISFFKKLFTKKILFSNQIEYRLLGYAHRDDGPAIIFSDGRQEWYQNGKQHCDSGAAYINNGHQEWYQNDQLHRDGGPAIIYDDGSQFWFQYGYLHRHNGPAIIYANGNQCWYQHGKHHRDDGPAIISNDGQYWYQHGKLINND